MFTPSLKTNLTGKFHVVIELDGDKEMEQKVVVVVVPKLTRTSPSGGAEEA